MPIAENKLVIDAETGKAIQSLVKLVQAQDRVDDSTKKMKRSQTETASAFDKGVSRVAALAAGYVSLSAGLNLARGAMERFNQLNEKSDLAAQGLMGFAVQTAGIPGGEKLMAHALAAGKGMTKAQIGTVGNALLSAYGPQAFPGAFDVGAQLVSGLGVSAESTGQLAAVARAKGIPFETFASRFLGATDIAVMTPEQMVQVAPSLTGFTRPEVGLGYAATLTTGGMAPEKVPLAVEALSRLLSKEESPLAKEFKFKNFPTEMGRVRAIQEKMLASGDPGLFARRLQEKYKIDVREARALRMILEQGDTSEQKIAQVMAIQPGGIGERIESLRGQYPWIQRQQDALAAAMDYETTGMIGPAGSAAGTYREKRLEYGRRFTQTFPVGSQVVPGMVDDRGQAGNIATGVIEVLKPTIQNLQGERNPVFQSMLDVLIDIATNTRPIVENSGVPARNANL